MEIGLSQSIFTPQKHQWLYVKIIIKLYKMGKTIVEVIHI